MIENIKSNINVINDKCATKLLKNFLKMYMIYIIKVCNFYNDICSPASIKDNDITLQDRKQDIYPYNISYVRIIANIKL